MKPFVFLLLMLAFASCNNSKNYTIVEPPPAKEDPADNLTKYGIDGESHEKIKPISNGKWAPDFKATDSNGNRLHLRQMLKDGPVVLIFYRGYWCPYCTKYLASFTADLAAIKKTNARIIAIAPEGAENQKKTVAEVNNNIIFVSDPALKIMDLYDIPFKVTDDYNQKIKDYKGHSLEEINGQEDAFLPIPATYVVGTDGKVKWSHFDPNYKNRPDVKEILAKLQELRGL